jgi:zinc protease
MRTRAGLFGLVLAGCVHAPSVAYPLTPAPVTPSARSSASDEPAPPRVMPPDAPFRAEAPPAPPTRPFDMPHAETWTLPNGLRVVLIADPLAFSVAASVVVRTPDTSPALTAAVHNVGCGSRRWPAPAELFAELSATGAEYAPATSEVAQEIRVTMPYFEAPRGLRAFADMVVGPVLEDACVERRQQGEAAASTTSAGDPTAATARVFEAMRAERGGRGTYLGTARDFAALTRADLAGAYAHAMRPEVATLVVVGHITRADLADMTATFGAPWPGPPGMRSAAPKSMPRPSAGPEAPVLVDMPGSTKTSVLIAIPAARWESADLEATLVATAILGNGLDGRVKHQLRDILGTTWSLNATVHDDGSSGWAMFRFEAPNDTLDDSMRAVIKELRAFAATGPTDAEVDASKRSAVADLAASLETPSTLRENLDLTVRFALPIAGDDARRILDVTPADVRRVASRLLLDHARVIVVGDRKIAADVTRRALGRDVELRDRFGTRVISP